MATSAREAQRVQFRVSPQLPGPRSSADTQLPTDVGGLPARLRLLHPVDDLFFTPPLSVASPASLAVGPSPSRIGQRLKSRVVQFSGFGSVRGRARGSFRRARAVQPDGSIPALGGRVASPRAISIGLIATVWHVRHITDPPWDGQDREDQSTRTQRVKCVISPETTSMT